MNRFANLLLLALLLLIPQESRAWSSTASKTSQRVMVLTKLVEEYRVDHGKLPSLEEFQEGLRPEGYPSFEDGYPFLDMWHQRILYKIPGKHGEYDLYSVGGDGIDDGGGKDDISSWNGVNEGYHWKRWWPLGRITLMEGGRSGCRSGCRLWNLVRLSVFQTSRSSSCPQLPVIDRRSAGSAHLAERSLEITRASPWVVRPAISMAIEARTF
ncbi:MAG: type II secretion system protein GspG [Verrucomicrobiota bacterium]